MGFARRRLFASFTHMTTFAELGLSQPVLQALDMKGYTTPTPIQEQAIPAVLKGRDLLDSCLHAPQH